MGSNMTPVWSITLLPVLLSPSVSSSPIPDQKADDSFHLRRGRRSTIDMENSISNIAAQLLLDEPASLEKLPKLESNTENQAKVVDHIKGLLSDIVTNTIVDDEAHSKHKGGVNMKTPTILQTVFSLDSNTIKDKESFIKVINKMTEIERQTNGELDTTTCISVFDRKKTDPEENNILE